MIERMVRRLRATRRCDACENEVGAADRFCWSCGTPLADQRAASPSLPQTCYVALVPDGRRGLASRYRLHATTFDERGPALIAETGLFRLSSRHADWESDGVLPEARAAITVRLLRDGWFLSELRRSRYNVLLPVFRRQSPENPNHDQQRQHLQRDKSAGCLE